MVIIVEGIDRVGKTTLAKMLSVRFGIPILKQERIGGNNQASNDNALINYGRALGLVDIFNSNCFTQNIILDRFHWTEAVYSLIDRNNNEQLLRMNEVELQMLKYKDKYLIIQVMPVDIKRCSRMHGSDLTQHQKEFDSIYSSSEMNKYRCTYVSYSLAIDEVERRLNNVKAK